ncbi:MAG: DUF2271 domain-containing protein [Spirochaetaceae bacterium]|jgi:hypothetical protein|nr:DUF2271 domain-containing protein [Spirochaetaceae bacterium]
MKRLVVLFFILGAVLLIGLYAQSGASGTVEISFSYTRQPGAASNQFAVWVEDAGGRVVKTIYATEFTARGGWERRPESIPQWVSRSGLSAMSRQGIDAFTAPTPRPGTLRYTWDGTGVDGAALPPGTYQVFLEATLRRENRVLYQAAVELGGAAAEIAAEPRYFGTGTAERDMIGQVAIRVRPRPGLS